MHVTALEKEKDINVRRHGAQSPVIEFGSDKILLAVPGLIRKAEKFAAVEFVRFLLRLRAGRIELFERSLLKPELGACSQSMQFVFCIRPVGSGDKRLLIIFLRIGMTAGDLLEVPELQQDFRILRLQAESLQIARFRVGEVPRLFVHVTALEKQEDINVRQRGAQSLIVKFGGGRILLAIPGRIRKAEQFALRLASQQCYTPHTHCVETVFKFPFSLLASRRPARRLVVGDHAAACSRPNVAASYDDPHGGAIELLAPQSEVRALPVRRQIDDRFSGPWALGTRSQHTSRPVLVVVSASIGDRPHWRAQELV
jgi:hypothetical protein